MPLKWYNRNYVGTQFGGSLYSMTDPWYMLMLLNVLGKDFEEAYELGPGKVTAGILKRFSKQAKCTNIEV